MMEGKQPYRRDYTCSVNRRHQTARAIPDGRQTELVIIISTLCCWTNNVGKAFKKEGGKRTIFCFIHKN